MKIYFFNRFAAFFFVLLAVNVNAGIYNIDSGLGDLNSGPSAEIAINSLDKVS